MFRTLNVKRFFNASMRAIVLDVYCLKRVRRRRFCKKGRILNCKNWNKHIKSKKFKSIFSLFFAVFHFFAFIVFFRFFPIFLLNFRFASIFSLNFRLFYLRDHFRFLEFRIEVNHVKSSFFFASKQNKIFASISNFASEAKVRAHPTTASS